MNAVLMAVCEMRIFIFKKTKTASSYLMLETVINSYYRGTTQFDELSTLSCTNIHAEMITGSVPGDAY